MDAWRARLEEARQAFLDDDEDDEANMAMALDQLQDNMDAPPPRRAVAGGSTHGKRANIERARVLMDERMHLDYFSETPVWGPSFFRRRYRMRRSMFLTILDRVCARDSYFFAKKGCLWIGGSICTSKMHRRLADACTGCVRGRDG
jgi:hypothetical protein